MSYKCSFLHSISFLPQLLVISQSDWLICRCRLESRQRCTRHARVNLSRNVIANQERPFWEINQSYCEKALALSLCHDFGHALN